MKQENVIKIGIIVAAVLVTSGVVGFLLTQRAQDAIIESKVQREIIPIAQTQKTTQTQTVPANFKTYTGDLSQLSPQFVGKKISFNYPASWGEVRAEKTAEGTVFEGPGEKAYDIWSISFSTGPQDKNNNYLISAIKIVDVKNYGASKDIAFLQENAKSNLPAGENELKALNELGHGYGSTVFFGVNSAKKYIPKNFTTDDQQIKGLAFFMQDAQALGTDLSYNVVLLDQKSNAIIGGQFYVTSTQQDQFEKDLNAIGSDAADKKSSTASAWQKKWETFINSSYVSNPDYIAQVKDIDLVMQSLTVQ